MRSALLVLVMGLVANGCSSTLEPEAVAGQWHQDFSIPGSFFQMNLAVNGLQISGTGSGCREAGPCVTSIITGSIDRNGVHLDILSSTVSPTVGGAQTSQSHFDGKVYLGKTMRGTLLVGGPGVEVGPPPLVTYERGLAFIPTLTVLAEVNKN